jgi:predicted nucleic acid-binding protein
MLALADTNILLRSLQRAHPMHADAWRAIRILKRRRELFIAPQNIVELWVVATRPIAQNGLGIPPVPARDYLSRFKRFLPLVPDTPEVHEQWEQLVSRYAVSGKKAHDTRLVASMLVHGLDTIITYNVDDFKRYTAITVLHPGNVK